MGPINGGPINLSRAKLREAFLRSATLTRADLRGADLTEADLREARLEGADLSGADLTGAALDGVDFSGAKLTGANLSGASLANARNLTMAQLHEAEGDAATVLPADFERPLIWTVAQGVDSRAAIARPMPNRIADPREEERPQGGERVSWLIGGPRAVGPPRPRRERLRRPGRPLAGY